MERKQSHHCNGRKQALDAITRKIARYKMANVLLVFLVVLLSCLLINGQRRVPYQIPLVSNRPATEHKFVARQIPNLPTMIGTYLVTDEGTGVKYLMLYTGNGSINLTKLEE